MSILHACLFPFLVIIFEASMLVFALLCFVAVASARMFAHYRIRLILSESCVGFSYSDQSAWGTIPCTNNLCGVGELQSPVMIGSKREASGDQLSQLRYGRRFFY